MSKKLKKQNKKLPICVGGKMHHVDQSKNDMAT